MRLLEMPKEKTSDLGLSEGFTITCHAGAMKTQANTVESIRRCVESGAQIVEMDVTFRADETPVIIHSSAPKENEGKLLFDALKVVASSKTCKVNLDLKAYSFLPEIDRIVVNLGLLERVFYTGVPEEEASTVKANSIIPFYLNSTLSTIQSKNEAELNKYAERIKAIGAIGMNINYTQLTKTAVEVMHNNGLPVSAWTVNNMRAAKRMLGYKVDNITTKCPDKLIKLIREMNN